MGNIRKEKNLFIITFDNGKTTSFDFATETYLGVSGKPIKQFSAEAKRVLKEYINENLIADYLYYKDTKSYHWNSVNLWNSSTVETIYSLYGNKYDFEDLSVICEFCYRENYVLNKNGIKLLNNALEIFKEKYNRHFDWYAIGDIMLELTLGDDTPPWFINIFKNRGFTEEERKILHKDKDKIIFRYNHELWKNLMHWDYTAEMLKKYINLTTLLNKERNYKNLLLSICLMEEEAKLVREKLSADYQLNANLFFEDENFTVVIPTTAEEFQHEADYQQNCVFRSYYPKVIRQDLHIVFIRRKDDVNTPYITCEVSNDGRIIQYLTRYNHCVTDANAIFFRDVYGEYLKRVFA